MLRGVLIFTAVLILLISALIIVDAQVPVSTFNVSNGTGLLELDMNKACVREFECQVSDSYYLFDCYYDSSVSKCRCFVGDESKCNVEAVKTVNSDFFENVKRIFASPITNILIVAGAFVVIILLYLSKQDSVENYQHKAIRYHRLAQHYHDIGNEELAKHYSKLADEYRERMEETEDEGMVGKA